MKYPAVRFNEAQRKAIAAGFGRAIKEAGYACAACCIGHDHAHMVLGRHERDTQIIAGHLKSHATRELSSQGVHPLVGYFGKRGGPPTPWAEGCWTIFIDNETQVDAAIRYVRRHPEKEGLKPQHWDFLRGRS